MCGPGGVSEPLPDSIPDPANMAKTLTLSNLICQKVSEVPGWSQEGVQGWILALSKVANYGELNGGVRQKC